MYQSSAYAVKGVEQQIPIYVYDGSGVALTGLVYTDIRMSLLKHDGTAFNAKSMTSSDWTEVGDGLYLIDLDEDDLDTTGYLVIKITADPGFVGTMRQSTKLVWVADDDTLAGGLVLDRPHWVPVLFQSGATVVGGLTDADVSTSDYLGPNETVSASLVLSGSTFRELLDSGSPTGIYQVLFPYTDFDAVGQLSVTFNGGTFDEFEYDYPVVKANVRRFILTVQDEDNDNARVIGATVYFSDLTTGLVTATAVTDGNGQVAVDLADGEYRVTLQDGLNIYHENNFLIDVRDPDITPESATIAESVSGNVGPYVLTDGDTLTFKINEGEEQTVTFEDTDFVAGASILSADANFLADIINTKAHSVSAESGGLGYQQLVLKSQQAGANSSVEVTGGTANAVLNFSTEKKEGTPLRRVVNGAVVNGAHFNPAFPADAADLVEVTFRIVDLEGNPVSDLEVLLVNKFSPTNRAPSGDAILGRADKPFYTNNDGILQTRNGRGKPKLIKGARYDVIIVGTGIVRQDMVVPNADFNLMDDVAAAEDIFTIQYPSFTRAPRS